MQTRDKAGFIVNRLLVPYMLDAIRAYEEGVGSVAEIDEAMKAGAGHPMGPLTLADFVGLDTMGAICDVMFDEFRERRFAQPPTLRKMLAAGWYGRKSGMGFYDYSGEEPVENPGSRWRTARARCGRRRTAAPLIAAGAVLVTVGVALEEIRLRRQLGPGHPPRDPRARGGGDLRARGRRRGQEGRPTRWQSVLLRVRLRAARAGAADARRRARRRREAVPAGTIVWIVAAARGRRAVARAGCELRDLRAARAR